MQTSKSNSSQNAVRCINDILSNFSESSTDNVQLFNLPIHVLLFAADDRPGQVTREGGAQQETKQTNSSLSMKSNVMARRRRRHSHPISYSFFEMMHTHRFLIDSVRATQDSLRMRHMRFFAFPEPAFSLTCWIIASQVPAPTWYTSR